MLRKISFLSNFLAIILLSSFLLARVGAQDVSGGIPTPADTPPAAALQDTPAPSEVPTDLITFFFEKLSQWGQERNILPELVGVGDAGNPADPKLQAGAVAEPFYIGKYEVTVGEYLYFVMAVTEGKPDDNPDPHHLWNSEIFQDEKVSPIANFKAIFDQVKEGKRLPGSIGAGENAGVGPLGNAFDLPISYVSLDMAKRYTNWLEHGHPFPEQGATLPDEVTETGAYEFRNGALGTPIPGANYGLPTLDQWVKAAYFKGERDRNNTLLAQYWNYPVASDQLIAAGEGFQAANFVRDMWWGNKNYFQNYLREDPTKVTKVDYFMRAHNVVSHYGVADMGGNVREWTLTRVVKDPHLVNPFGGLGEDCWGVQNQMDQLNSNFYYTPGGSWNTTVSSLSKDTIRETSFYSGYCSNDIGFRIVARNPETEPEIDAPEIQQEQNTFFNPNDLRPSSFLTEFLRDWTSTFIMFVVIGLLDGFLASQLLVLVGCLVETAWLVGKIIGYISSAIFAGFLSWQRAHHSTYSIPTDADLDANHWSESGKD